MTGSVERDGCADRLRRREHQAATLPHDRIGGQTQSEVVPAACEDNRLGLWLAGSASGTVGRAACPGFEHAA